MHLVWLNKTRTRAGLSELTIAEVSTRDQFIRALADERGREFALEGHRWFDLVRLGLAIETMRAAGFTLDEHNLIFPIPQNQIEIVNNASILWQNPGYNS
ncbi:RagB/SusD family nutrient uptake outer membrane protein [Muribaculum intestinale]|uniref:RagB/SusD family nutrient uptake outer membrane protein n=1 Tax=Muribaculum intestinale TaxID=1796646 RepID=UPI001C3EF5BB|nr:RagB/SusD family nutrient uptake outer membrane protein [Muribaculum intestinale]